MVRVAIDNQEYIPIGMNVSVFAGNESRRKQVKRPICMVRD